LSFQRARFQRTRFQYGFAEKVSKNWIRYSFENNFIL